MTNTIRNSCCYLISSFKKGIAWYRKINDTGNINVQVILDGKSETIRALQKTIAEIFNVDRVVITRHTYLIYLKLLG